eukprot:5709714-Prymnesium_polylepis.1
MRVAHGFIIDALNGRRLDVLRQCVPIKIETKPSGTKEQGAQLQCLDGNMVQEVIGLANHLSRLMASRLAFKGELPYSPALLVVAGPAM